MPVPLVEAAYAFHQLSVYVRYAEVLREDLAVLLRHLGFQPNPAATSAPELYLECQLVVAPPRLPPNAEPLARHERGFYLSQVPGAPALWLSREGFATAHVIPSTGAATIWLAASLQADRRIWRDTLCDALILSLLALLQHQGWYMLHAAAVVRDGAGYLLAGKSHSGKSTLAYQLLRRGWCYLADDMILLRDDGAQVQAAAMGRDFRLTPAAIRLFPELKEWQATHPVGDDKWHIPVDALFPNQVSFACPPQVLIFPEIVAQPESTLEPLRPPDAFLRLLSQMSLLAPTPDQAQRHLHVLRQLVGQTRCYQLRAGQDLLDIPSRAEALLSSLST